MIHLSLTPEYIFWW